MTVPFLCALRHAHRVPSLHNSLALNISKKITNKKVLENQYTAPCPSTSLQKFLFKKDPSFIYL